MDLLSAFERLKLSITRRFLQISPRVERAVPLQFFRAKRSTPTFKVTDLTEGGVLRGWGQKGERVRGFAPQGRWRALTFLGAPVRSRPRRGSGNFEFASKCRDTDATSSAQ